MTVSLHSQAAVTLDEARVYLQDNGAAVESSDFLKMHINGVTALMQVVTGRKHLQHVDDDTITEIRDGSGATEIWTREAPIQTLTTVTLDPYLSSSVEIDGPGATAYNDDMWYNSDTGLITLKSRTFPKGNSTVQIVYEAGFLSTDLEMMGLKMIALEAIASKWARFKNQLHGIASESNGDHSVTYTLDDFSKNAMAEMRRYRRTLFA